MIASMRFIRNQLILWFTLTNVLRELKQRVDYPVHQASVCPPYQVLALVLISN